MSRRDNQFRNDDSSAWIEVMGRNLGGGVTLTLYAENGDERHGVRLCDHASVSLDAAKLRGLATQLVREADALDGAAASSGERVTDEGSRVCENFDRCLRTMQASRPALPGPGTERRVAASASTALETPTLRLTQAEFNLLPEYSRSLPTGVTMGKRWKRRWGAHSWIICEYGGSDAGRTIVNYYRPEILVDPEALIAAATEGSKAQSPRPSVRGPGSEEAADTKRLNFLELSRFGVEHFVADDQNGEPTRHLWIADGAGIEHSRATVREAIDAAMNAGTPLPTGTGDSTHG